MAALVIVRADVEDHDNWRTGFDAAAEFRDAAGVGEVSIHHEPGDRSKVVVLHTFDSVEAAEAFFSNPDLAEKMKQSGVIGRPQIDIYETI